jgi:hypothetical protein
VEQERAKEINSWTERKWEIDNKKFKKLKLIKKTKIAYICIHTCLA